MKQNKRYREIYPNFFQDPSVKEFVFLGCSVLVVIIFGTVGYETIEGWDWFDSLYMTIITLSTIGYQEVHPLSDSGRFFTIILVLLGLGIVSVVLTTVAHKIIQQEVTWLFKRSKVDRIIRRMKGHTIICGYGRLTRIVAQALSASGQQLIIIEADEHRCVEAEQDGFLVLHGDATQEETLRKAGVAAAKQLVSLLPKDSDNLYVILSSKEMNPGLFIFSRAEDDIGEKRLKKAGAARIVSPYRIGGQKIADGLLRPYVTDFIDLAGSASGHALQLEEILIPANSPLNGRMLKDSGLRQKTNIIVAAIISKEGEMQFNPSGDTIIEAGSTLIGLGFKSDFLALENILIPRG